MMKSTVIIVLVVVFAMLAIEEAKSHHTRKHRWTPKIYEVKVDPSDTVMDNSTCAKRCEKEDMTRKAKVYMCSAFYTGAASNQCFLSVLHCQKKGAFKKPTDLTECADCFRKAAKPKWGRKGGKSSSRNNHKWRGKTTAKEYGDI
ncbi:uncharacterized protein LOC135501572 [Lineus longissimus]|uniref:uncharacterized protein LOC135501572 n=1 Tax=Lineus longissimus TaxID=88925 RepID=UPI002B4CBD72